MANETKTEAFKYERVIMRAMNVFMIMLLLLVVLNFKRCTDSMTITQYDGFKHACEKQGGVVQNGMCWDPGVLVDVETDERPVLKVDMKSLDELAAEKN